MAFRRHPENTVHIPSHPEIRDRKIYCSNCGYEGHMFRSCQYPITSYGILAMRYTSDLDASLFSNAKPDITHLMATRCHEDPLEYLLICRRDSISFIEFVRGKYPDKPYLQDLFRNMTVREHEKIRHMNFDELWRSVWGSAADTHKADHDTSYRKYIGLGPIHLLLDACPTAFLEPEWGIPKGRRNIHEQDISGAIREFKEETNLQDKDFQILQNIPPLVESFVGSNGVRYCHKYYLALCKPTQEVALSHENPHMSREIGSIGWFSYETALAKIRPHSPEKKEILTRASRVMKSFYPL